MWFRPILLLFLAGVCFVAAQVTGIRLYIHLSYLLLALIALSLIWAWLNLRGLEIRRETFTTRTQVGEFARERITLRNRWPLPKLWIELRDHSDLPDHAGGFVTFLPGSQSRRWVSRTLCTMRGKFTLGPATITSGDPFGLFRLSRALPGSSEIIVYPATVELASFNLPGAELSGGQDLRRRTFHITPNVSTVREYAPGDSFNRIHWRSTARTGQLMVKEFELDPSAEIYLVLDMQESVQQVLPLGGLTTLRDRRGREWRSLESTEEYAVSATASIAQFLLRQNRTVGMIAWGQQREVIPAEREARQFFKILEALAVVRAYGSQPLAEVLAAENARFGRNCTLVIVTASLDRRWTDWVQQLRYRGVQSVVVFVDPQSFGGRHDPSAVLGRLSELHVPVYRLRYSESLLDALRNPLSVSVSA